MCWGMWELNDKSAGINALFIVPRVRSMKAKGRNSTLRRERGKLCNLRGDRITKKHRKANRQLRTDGKVSLSSKPVSRWCEGEFHADPQVTLESSQPW